jgi:Xaa-Pro aminopeptidase
MSTQIQLLHDRLALIRQQLPTWQADGILITGATNRRWASGFTGSAGQLLITANKALLATDFRYWQQAKDQAPAFELFQHQRTDEDTQKLLAAAGVTRLALEAKQITLHEADNLQKLGKGIAWVPLAKSLEGLRQVKTAVEIEALRTAAAITDYAMSQINEIAQPGMSERALAWELEKIMRERGADGLAFDIIVAAGPHGAHPHHRAGDRQLQEGDAIVVDMGCQLNGYRSDLTRTFHLGSNPSAQFWEIYNLVLAAQQAALANLRPGMTLRAANATAREVITAAGHGDHFGHGLGHGVGLDIHEDPFMSVRAEEADRIVAGATITVEPGVYLPGWGGVRIEDFVQVTDDGVTMLSHCPKNPIIPTK